MDFSQANYLVTGDKKLLKLKKFQNTKIVSISEFSKIFPYD